MLHTPEEPRDAQQHWQSMPVSTITAALADEVVDDLQTLQKGLREEELRLLRMTKDEQTSLCQSFERIITAIEAHFRIHLDRNEDGSLSLFWAKMLPRKASSG